MLSVSSGFMTNMGTQTDARQTYGRVEFKQVDTTAVDDVTVTATSTETISDPQYSADGEYLSFANYATFETDRWLLDGSFKLLPTTAPYDNMGWWSSAFSGAGGSFAVTQVLTYQFTVDHDSIGFTIFFDKINNEFAVDFSLVAYNSSNVVINTFTVTGNTLTSYRVETPVADYRKVILNITKWSKVDRRARVEELIFGLNQVYDGNKLISLKLVEEIDPVSIKSPQNEFSFSIDNSDYAYDILNPDGVYSYLQKKMEIIGHIGIMVNGAIEYAKLGTFYLLSWNTPTKLEASFVARDRLELLQKTYRKGLYQSRTLYNLAIDVLTEEGLTADDYSVDTALQSITVNSYIPILKTREALNLIAVAGNAICYIDRDNKITIKQLTATSTGYEIDFNNAYSTPAINLDNVVKTVDVNVSAFNNDTATTDIFKGAITLAGTSDIWIDYKDHAINGSATV
ncbi:MAG: hypothetical protein RLY43_2523, partial [Bacteroidota bacterium]